MKKAILHSLLILFFACGIGKGVNNPETHVLRIMLTEKAESAAIITDYTSYGLTELKIVSLSQPLYATTVNLNDTDLTRLLEALKADDRIVSADKTEQNPSNSNSTNDGFGTSRPKNKN